jgi:hypothetical protein
MNERLDLDAIDDADGNLAAETPAPADGDDRNAVAAIDESSDVPGCGEIDGGPDDVPMARSEETDGALAAVGRVFAAPDRRVFYGGLIGVLTSGPRAGERTSSSGRLLRVLGAALADALDEETVLLEIVQGGRTSVQSSEAIAVVAAIVARVACGSALLSGGAVSVAEAAELVHVSVPIVAAAVGHDRAQSWHRLPQTAIQLGHRNTRRNLPIADLAAALPRLWARAEARSYASPIFAPEQLWTGRTAQPHLMILNGPVEIVILGR